MGWDTDQVACWIGATSVLATATGSPIEQDIRDRVQMLLAAQDSDGLFYGEKLNKEKPAVH